MCVHWTGFFRFLSKTSTSFLCKEKTWLHSTLTIIDKNWSCSVEQDTEINETVQSSPSPPKHTWHVSSTLPYSPSKQRHQFSGVRSFAAKSPVDLHKVCVLQLSTDGLQLVVRLVNNSGLYFRQGFGRVIPLSDSLPDSDQSGLCFPSSTSSLIFFSLSCYSPSFHQKLFILIWICYHLVVTHAWHDFHCV